MQARIYGTLRGRSGLRSLDVDLPAGATVRQALTALAAIAPALRDNLLDDRGDMQPTIMVFRSGRNVDLLAGADTPLQPGHVFSVEPGLYYQQRDLGMRIEDSVAFTESGELVNLNVYPYDLVLPMRG